MHGRIALDEGIRRVFVTGPAASSTSRSLVFVDVAAEPAMTSDRPDARPLVITGDKAAADAIAVLAPARPAGRPPAPVG
jgi:hypothetical protein